jgi:hypothetical protein
LEHFGYFRKDVAVREDVCYVDGEVDLGFEGEEDFGVVFESYFEYLGISKTLDRLVF